MIMRRWNFFAGNYNVDGDEDDGGDGCGGDGEGVDGGGGGDDGGGGGGGGGDELEDKDLLKNRRAQWLEVERKKVMKPLSRATQTLSSDNDDDVDEDEVNHNLSNFSGFR